MWHVGRQLYEACNLYVSRPVATSQGNPITSLSRPLGVATEADPASISPCDLPETYGSYILWVLMGVNVQRSETEYGAVCCEACNL